MIESTVQERRHRNRMQGTQTDHQSHRLRQWPSGAVRDQADDKPEYGGYLSPQVIACYGRYMLRHQRLPTGGQRSSRNWQRGIPREAYLQSLLRHVVDVWLQHEGHPTEAREGLADALCGILFNASGYLYEVLNGRDVGAEAASEEPSRTDGGMGTGSVQRRGEGKRRGAS